MYLVINDPLDSTTSKQVIILLDLLENTVQNKAPF